MTTTLQSSMATWRELMVLIAKYDWAVEGAPAPEGTEMTREEAAALRTRLVELAGEAA